MEGLEVSVSSLASFSLAAPLGAGTRQLLLIPQCPSSFAPPAGAFSTHQAMRSPQVGFLHGEAVLVDAGGGHAAAEHVL